MSTITLLDLLQCAFWAIGALIPVFISLLSGIAEGERDQKNGSGIFILLVATGFQAAILICAYKAGGK